MRRILLDALPEEAACEGQGEEMTPPRRCARSVCRKPLVRRPRERPADFANRKFCSTTCATRCSGWGHKDARDDR